MDKEQDRRVRQGFEAHMVELPKPASLMRTHISTPIRSIMSISSEEGHVLARQDVLIRMEDDADEYDSDIDVREHQFKESTSRYSNRNRTRNSRDTFHIRHSSNHNYTHHLPNQLNSSISTSSRQGLRHHQHQQQQQPLYSPHRDSFARASYCSSIVPLTPKIPQQYISPSSAES
ncbi:hypothetical protein BGX30_008875 [Mortierella sp. GBA39]|nr:hypothetical protein BGX30_008875 [Mortierella sp. GBA39]